ncbi:MAG: IS1634 family transposase [Deltaproteobacteria bacterium]|jgi:transposase|nr:IS1634 family transposase [Deltaproteobacteria bacterium]
MTHLTRRKKGGKTYYYLARTTRINGKPRQIIMRSLGTAEDMENVFKKANDSIPEIKPDFCRIYQFGAEAALLNIAERLGVANIIDELAPNNEQGLSVGSYMVLAAINRAVQPTSQKSFYEWFQKTVLSDAFPQANEKTLSGQNFWRHTHGLDQSILTSIEDKITKNIIEKYDIDTNCLLFDNKKFITYIDTSNPALIPQCGHSKEKRSDLKIIGLSLLASPDSNIPLFHETYQENRCDSTQSTNIIDKLKLRFSKISNKSDEITLVFDKGNNSDQAIENLKNDSLGKFPFVGGLCLNQGQELIELKGEQYEPLKGDFEGSSAFRLRKEISGREFTVLITDDPRLRKTQLVGLRRNIVKCEKEFFALQESLKLREEGQILRGKTRTVVSTLKNIQKIFSIKYMKNIFTYNITEDDNNIILSYSLDKNKYNFFVNNYLGKTIIFTNRDEWSNEQIVSTYRSQFHVKEAFKQIKNIKHLSFRPVRHFTDNMMTIHSFYCVLAFTLSCLLQLEMEKLGFKMSVNAVLNEFSEAKQTLNFYLGETKEKPTVASVFSEMSPG